MGPVGTAYCCVLHRPSRRSLATTVDIHPLTSLQDNTGWSSRWFLTFLSVFSTMHKPTFLCLRTKQWFNTISGLEAADQSPMSGCLVASRRCLLSTADEGWHSQYRPYSTVAHQQFVSSTKISTFSLNGYTCRRIEKVKVTSCWQSLKDFLHRFSTNLCMSTWGWLSMALSNSHANESESLTYQVAISK